MNKVAQSMISKYNDDELLDLFAELKSELSNPSIILPPRQFSEDAEMLEITQKEILKRMKGGRA